MLSIFGPIALYAQTHITKDISTNQIWDKTGNPFYIDTNIKILQGITLEVKPGVVIESPLGYAVEVSGTIKVQGSYASNININNVNWVLNADASPLILNGQRYQMGSIFEYCNFQGDFQNNALVKSYGPGVIISNSSILGFNNIVSFAGNSSDTSVFFISNVTHYGERKGLFEFHHSNAKLWLFGSDFESFGHLSFPDDVTIFNCSFKGSDYADSINLFGDRVGLESSVDIGCTRFENFKSNVLFLERPDRHCKFSLEMCYFDQARNFYVQKNGDSSHLFQPTLVYNTFVEARGYIVFISGKSAKSSSIEFKKCYWDIQDKQLIPKTIYDASDDVSVNTTVVWDTLNNYKFNGICTLIPFVHKVNHSKGVKVFPNPSSDVIAFDSDETLINAKIFNALGVEVMTVGDIEPGQVIPIDTLGNGLYYISYYNGYNMPYCSTFLINK